MIEQEIADIQKRILEQEDLLNTVQIEKFELKKRLVDIMEAIRKCEYILSKLKVEERLKTREFWAQRRGG